MRKINTKDIEERSWASPKGKFGGTGEHRFTGARA